MNFQNRWLLLCLLPACTMASETFIPYGERPEVHAWTERLVDEHDLPAERVRKLISDCEHQPKVIASASRPAESKPWHWYRNIFLTDDRIRRGRTYLREHARLLEEAERIYQVPTEVITAIVAAESNFGRNTGAHPVLDTLVTLGFDYSPRGEFFRKQLGQLFLLEREAGLDIKKLRGSWAGALGQAQFIPSSYRDFAVDGDQDGRRDLWDSPADIIFSIANYFEKHHWRLGEPVAELIQPKDPEQLPLSKALLPDIPSERLAASGIRLQHPTAEPVAVHRFENASSPEYWVGYHNFYVITRYNHSALYALMIHQLSRALKNDPGL
ncbi:MAG: lytic murein transglycosylase B [Gammaproteobacteria bacterium]|nr:lytic murein transglycosylase B [Gammaproteobacteria bacterium]